MIDCTLTIERQRHGVAGRRIVRQAGSAAVHAIETILLWMERAEQRRQLARLDNHLLKDIGVTRPEAAREAAKPFWRP